MQSRTTLATFAVVGLSMVAFGALLAALLMDARSSGRVSADAAMEFPAEILRTDKAPPDFVLQNQLGEDVSVGKFAGKVVVVTAVYASCHAACPTILTQLKSALKRLPAAEQEEVAVIAITLDPDKDTQSARAMTAKSHGLHAPQFNYVNGSDPADVLKLIADFGYARTKPDEAGVIGHSNLFTVIDRRGRIAYTVSADTESKWLDDALRTLLDEPAI